MTTTQHVIAKYTELYDISTDVGKNIHYKIHTPTGVSHMKKLAGFYKQFKEYKYMGATIAWVPITTLPKDLLGVGYEAGDDADPRDLINPILHKGYKGESLITDYLSERILWSENEDATDKDFSGIHGPNNRIRRMTEAGGISKIGVQDEATNERANDWLRGMYYTSLTDPEWRKAHPREGFYKELFPVVRTLAATGRIGNQGIPQDFPTGDSDAFLDRDNERLETTPKNPHNELIPSATTNIPNREYNQTGTTIEEILAQRGINQTDVFTHEFERLGWLETSGKGGMAETINIAKAGNITTDSMTATDLDLNRMPKVYMYLVQTPPAYKQKQFYRMSITHQFKFRKFRQVYGIDMPNIWSDEETHKERGLASLPRHVAGMKMYNEEGKLYDDDFIIPPYEPALENTIETDGDGVTIEKISDGVL